MKVSVVNLGCKVNRVESDTIAATYLQNGSTLVNAAEAELIVVNTCTVTEEAEKKTRKTIRKLLRENNSASMLVTAALQPLIQIFTAPLMIVLFLLINMIYSVLNFMGLNKMIHTP